MGYGSGGYVYGGIGRPKGFGKGSSAVLAGKYANTGYFHHKRRSFDFGQRKRANAKTKMRGVFGVRKLFYNSYLKEFKYFIALIFYALCRCLVWVYKGH